jgi:outer membrane protein assembly factor BamB
VAPLLLLFVNPFLLSIKAAQVDPVVRDSVLPAAVQIAILVSSTENGVEEPLYIPVGSGTVVSPDGLILTNQHVVDMTAHAEQVARWEVDARSRGEDLRLSLNSEEFLILGSENARPPSPMYLAQTVDEDSAIDLAVLRITSDSTGTPVDFAGSPLAFARLGDSNALSLGEPIDIFSYPVAGGDSLTYTVGVVSGFNFDDGSDEPAWITTDATISGGSSGGTAVNRRGELVGVPTQGSALDCRPGDTNIDGVIDSADVGCIPVGGSIGQIRPINLALPLMNRSGIRLTDAEPTETVQSTDLPLSASITSPTQRWSIDLGARVGVPATSAGIVFASTRNTETEAESSVLYALDSVSGLTLWSLPFTELVTDPVAANGVVYVGGKGGNLYALDAATGQERWRFAGGFSARKPVLSNGRILGFFSDEAAIGLSAFDPAAWPGEVGEVLIAIDAETGQQVWRFDATGSIGSPVATPNMIVVRSSGIGSQEVPSCAPRVKAAASNRGSQANAVVGIAPETGDVVWRCWVEQGALATVAADSAMVFVSEAFYGANVAPIVALDALSSKEQWTNTTRSTFDLLPAGEKLIFRESAIFGESSDMISVDKRTGVEEWRFPTSSGTSNPVLAAANLYFVSDRTLYVVEASSGRQLWALPLQDDLWLKLSADESGLYIGSDSGYLYAFNIA